jgi:hypothetical protein
MVRKTANLQRGRCAKLLLKCCICAAAITDYSTVSGARAADFFHDVGRAIEKGAQDAGHAIEKGAHATGEAIEKGTQDTGHVILNPGVVGLPGKPSTTSGGPGDE